MFLTRNLQGLRALRVSRFSTSTRLASAAAAATATSRMQPMDCSEIKITKADKLKPMPELNTLQFGKEFTDHMLIMKWNKDNGWNKPEIVPFGNLSMHPASSVFHYSFECFEGMKAYKDANGVPRLFRPIRNAERMLNTGRRISLPDFDPNQLVEGIKKFVDLESRWVPQERGYSLYIRPTFIGTDSALGVHDVGNAMLFVIASPVGPYYKSGFKAVKLCCSENIVRAWPGGSGHYKLGGNYAPSVVPAREAGKKGFAQILWLYGEEDYVTEVGTMNCFTVWINKNGEKEIITAPLDGMILPGVTRASVLDIARERLAPQGWKITEGKYSMKDVAQAANEGRLLEVFGSGTAALVSPVKAIQYRGKEFSIPLPAGKEAGPITEQISNWILDIQYGKEPNHPWSVPVRN
ncbi:branched chain amino acid aminotransferase Eca39 [Schizosaccharomyces japonicus yFS275]|uniref:Branched-chain-amino-acid aminotransferase n=1 Tax=Schizosaccharomyces japonicus (strain yFS275 / FY16936) TaxID=402676 RepID=B6K620_SCHJY|nr:branched chain amino acid aminotransferase Eca39 [Schizosaccharomyces japonicus yFS275]EEB08974.2 branched chain amino acid aminotransferase Eca39 [Schizosaccharomyces japonicus yFS275]